MTNGVYKAFMGYRCWMIKTFDFKHGYGYHVQLYSTDYEIGYGFSKNKFTAVRNSIKDINKL